MLAFLHLYLLHPQLARDRYIEDAWVSVRRECAWWRKDIARDWIGDLAIKLRSASLLYKRS